MASPINNGKKAATAAAAAAAAARGYVRTYENLVCTYGANVKCDVTLAEHIERDEAP
jgi:hypothetical protein